ncbi:MULTISPECIES: metallophosphoesterase family protein [Bradyrhizobium]|jgi:serine/threonine protein phosphatase 1|uniref:Serine/threonine protein phosphatase n=1 Tax=Bradyrhizobium ottawaense TaxID=931866 RepID=A0A2U8P008_9BRAD|nr:MULTISPECIES: metallophosphoesterase family protein [Bradyrhizobium]AWL91013.1 serine/threonine protein phosphatase [Bradyrhizobium ottawaense]MBR1330952.1 serine/threonine protein phosphatase [Bradyrhizobium ottawaense]MBR1337616.1 serine/threonine protein phosphatase [Bradyrhizobium ottawaense]MBR1364875.1 serine/threonine protein phosphatase [Bradyrhizobium ottawaense]MDA9418853.1 metallophosphoesterase [Bradyrhizobium sp. CCBAU 25360]
MISLARPRPPIPKPQLPEGVRIYAISDIHGCAHLLQPMLRVIDADVACSRPRYAVEVFMGDYIDRGPDTRSTLDVLIERSRRGNAVFLKGNHEAFLVRVFEDPSLFEDWIAVGGTQTLMSYGLAPPDLKRDEPASIMRDLIRAMPTEHLEFLDNLRLSFSCGDFFFVHAGVRPGVPLAEQTERDLLWIREEFLRSEEQFGKYIVHGHTPVRSAEFMANRVNIDTGAYATGNLTLMSIQGSRMLAV